MTAPNSLSTVTEPVRLLACPFCGATPHRGLTKPHRDQLHGELLHHYRIWCPHDCASKRAINEDLAASAWNTRTAAQAEEASFVRTVGEELVSAGMPAGDRTVILANIRSLIAQPTQPAPEWIAPPELTELYANSRPVQGGKAEAVREALESISDWCSNERGLIGAVNGYDYRSGEEYGMRRAEIEIIKRLKALPAASQPASNATPQAAKLVSDFEQAVSNRLSDCTKGAELEAARNAVLGALSSVVAYAGNKPIGRQWIVDLIRDQFDPAPAHYKLGDNWDDGAEAIAEAVLAQLPLLRTESVAIPSTEGK